MGHQTDPISVGKETISLVVRKNMQQNLML
jgi:hypothetical protein